jgi:hypothetical protein
MARFPLVKVGWLVQKKKEKLLNGDLTVSFFEFWDKIRLRRTLLKKTTGKL